MEWEVHEKDCHEEDFGVCYCESVSPGYCEQWFCHAYEAEQQVCYWDSSGTGEGEVRCEYDAFPMSRAKYDELRRFQGMGALTTGERSSWFQLFRAQRNVWLTA